MLCSSTESHCSPAVLNSQLSTLSSQLRRYFYSGWAFLIPYLVVYLLYAWQKWPVNPASTMLKVAGVSESAAAGSWIPSLLYAYWALHALHLALAAIALRSWWNGASGASSKANAAVPVTYPLPATRYSLLRPLLPWALLTLLFYIPGIYLEWPSDPWQHLRRINEWHAHNAVMDHSVWRKSSYFLPYSLTGHLTGLRQLSWLNVYYTTICLLLCWQYYRLARAVGIGERASFIFVLLQALMMGNNIFSFYRYYGLSSSIYAQLGAVALTRITLEFATWKTRLSSRSSLADFTVRPSFWHGPSLFILLTSSLALFLLTAFNHIQGLGIAGLGIMAVIVWRLIEWKRSMIVWLALTATTLSVATVLWFPRHPALDELYRAQGWLSAWYGFNLFAPSSLAFNQSLQILGPFGALNIVIGLWLILRRNDIVGWLTLMPMLTLALPCFALPFAHMLASKSETVDGILIFHRLFFAVPLGLAFVTAFFRDTPHPLPSVASPMVDESMGDRHLKVPKTSSVFLVKRIRILLVALGLLVTLMLPSGQRANHRLWHSLAVTPADLQLDDLVSDRTPHPGSEKPLPLILAGPQPSRALQAIYSERAKTVFRSAKRSSLEDPSDVTAWLISAPGEISLLSSFSSAAVSTRNSSWLALPLSSLKDQDLTRWLDFTAMHTPWLRLDNAGETALVTLAGTIGNSPGQPAHLFAKALIKIDHKRRYRVSASVRQPPGVPSSNYLAIAWYDLDGRLLSSNLPTPEGAGQPDGWSNGSYSYYGLFGEAVSSAWTRYSTVFGYGENVVIPSEASYLRVGALLNFFAVPTVALSLKDVTLEELPGYPEALLFLPPPSHLYTPGSLAARLSGHWGAQHVHRERAGTSEIRESITTARAH